MRRTTDRPERLDRLDRPDRVQHLGRLKRLGRLRRLDRVQHLAGEAAGRTDASARDRLPARLATPRGASCCLLLWALGTSACAAEPEGLAPAIAADVAVKLDFGHRPLPEVPLPNDLATRFDADSPTGRRVNASMIAATEFEQRTRRLVDGLDGWGVYAPITVPFDGPIDIDVVIDRHHLDDYAFANDAVYVIDVTPGSPTYGKPSALDLGNGNFPQVLEKMDAFWESDARGDTISLLFEEHDEDLNGDGVLDPGEDTDLDGALDVPNYTPAGLALLRDRQKKGEELSLAERADATMGFYERDTNTLIMRALQPLRERTTYAVVITRRLVDTAGKPVGSPFPWIHHLGQTDALRPLEKIFANSADFGGLKLTDVAFTWSFTTGTMYQDVKAVRDGLYGHGTQKHLGEDFPPDLVKLHGLHSGDPKHAWENAYRVSSESFGTVVQLLELSGLVSLGGKEQKSRYQDALRYVDYHVVGTYNTPMLFGRTGADGDVLGYNDQSWPADMERVPATAEAEAVTFWMSVPRKDAVVDAQGKMANSGKPWGVVILGHGYTGSKTEMLTFHAYFAEMGLAVVAIDNVSHGFTLSADEEVLLADVLDGFGIGPFAAALTSNRSTDQNADGMEDSGADFWTAYTFHTRDVVRQTLVDYMQLIRVLRSWDGSKLWAFDVNGNGKADDIAGDFDGDGTVDVGGADMPITMTGGSLGGIMAAMVGGAEPQVAAVAPIAGGGGLGDVGIRSIQGGVKEAVELRVMGPLYVGFPDSGSGEIAIRAVVPNLNDTGRVEVARLTMAQVEGLEPGDSVLVENLTNGESDCALLLADKSFRVAIASSIDRDHPERHRLRFFKGNAFQLGVVDPTRHRACKLRDDVGDAVAVVDQFGVDVDFHFRSEPLSFQKGEPLAPIAEGLGLHRGRPELRRFIGFAQLVLDQGDPAVWSRHFLSGEMTYATGETVATHALVVNTVGDMNVPVNTGASIGRAAGLLDFNTPIAEWGGRTVNQVVIDSYVLEAVDTVKRFTNGAGAGVLFDPEDLSESATPTALPPLGEKIAYTTPFHVGKDGYDVPRLSPPLHTHAVGDDGHGGVSGTFFPYVQPYGQHGFWEPGAHTDKQHAACKAASPDAKICDETVFFDHGSMLIHTLGFYLRDAGTKPLRFDACQVNFSCADVAAPPEVRK